MAHANEAQLSAFLKNDADLMAKKANLENIAAQQIHVLADHEENQRTMNQQTNTAIQQQLQHQQMGAREHATLQAQQESLRTREGGRSRGKPPNRQCRRCAHPSGSPSGNAHGASAATRPDSRTFGPRDSPARLPPDTLPAESHPANTPSFHRIPPSSPIGYAPFLAVGFPNMVIDSCPSFTPGNSQGWKREIELRATGQPGASLTHLLAKLIRVLPLAIQTEALLYMERTGQTPDTRSVAVAMDMVDSRYGMTDSERARS